MSVRSSIYTELKTYMYVAGKLDIRRYLLDSTGDTRYTELLSKLSKTYYIEAYQNLLIYWKDLDGEFVSVTTADDLQAAITAANCSTTKLYVVNVGSNVVDEFEEAAKKTARATACDNQSTKTETENIGDCSGSRLLHPFVTCYACNRQICGRRSKCINKKLCERCELVESRCTEHNIVIHHPESRASPYMIPGCHMRGEEVLCENRRLDGGSMDGAPLCCCKFGCSPFSITSSGTPPDNIADQSGMEINDKTVSHPAPAAVVTHTETPSSSTFQHGFAFNGRYEVQLKRLLEMGFSNEDSILEQLLAVFNGDIIPVLEALIDSSIASRDIKAL